MNVDQYQLDGQRIRLRQLRLDEITECYCKWMNNPEINRYLESRYRVWDRESLRDYVTSMEKDKNSYLFAVATIEDDQHIGNIKLGPVDWNHRRGSIGILIGDSRSHGKGFGGEAIMLLARFAFQELELNKVTASAYVVNRPSVRLFEKLNFATEGVRRGHAFCDNEFVDCIEFGLLRSEWLAQNG